MEKRVILYLIMKLKFFVLLEKRDPNANIFYFDFFQKIVKEIKGNGYERKNASFIKIMNNHSALDRINIISYFENKFMFTFTKELSNFIFNPDINSIRSQASFDTFITQSVPQQAPQQNQVFDNETNNQDDDCNREREIKDFSILSTQEELSDDEFLQNAPCFVNETNSDYSNALLPSNYSLI
jgi:hypothetical protein